MHLDPVTGLWKPDDNDYTPRLVLHDSEDDPEEKPEDEQIVEQKKKKEKKLIGRCVLSIRFQNHGEYLRWKQFAGIGRQWEFMVEYPAIMRSEEEFTNALEVEMLAKKIVQMLECGIDVYSAQWQLKKEKEEENEDENHETR